jgi:hypothetical protein
MLRLMLFPRELKVISNQYPVISGLRARQTLLITSLTQDATHEVKTVRAWTGGADTNRL